MPPVSDSFAHSIRLMKSTVRAFLASSLRPRKLSADGALLLLAAGLFSAGAGAQQTVVLPNTISSVAGNVPTASTANAACPTNAQFTATDVAGDGCPAVNAVFSGNERSMTVDPQGNIYVIADTANPQAVRRIDARTGNISVYAGGGSGNACSSGVSVFGTTYTQTDKLGDGCPVSFSGGFNGGRGLGSDPYGNIIIPVTGDYVVHFVCNTVSPLCTAAQARVNLMRNIAGCTLTTTGYGTSVSGTTVGTAGDGTNAVQIGGSTCAVGTNQPRQAVGDKWGNVYFNDSSNSRIRVILGVASYNGVTNPLYAAMALFTATNTALASPTQGFIYPIAGGAISTTNTNYALCAAKTDAGGDNCPFYQTVVGSTTYVQGEAVTPEGDFLFTDGLGNLRVIYLGGATVQKALAANGVTSPQIGYSYALIGPPSTNTSATNLYYNSALSGTYLGNTVKLQASATQRIATDAVGNVYIGDQAQVFFYDIYTGYVRRLGGGTTATVCSTGTPLGDGCPVAQSLFGAANSVLAVALDNLGNLYIQDLTNKLIRRVSATTLPTTAVNGTLATGIVVHSPVAATVAVTAAASPDFTATAPTCAAANADGSVDCTAPVTYAPKQLNLRNDPVTISSTVGTTVSTIPAFLDATSTGSALAFDSSSTPLTANLGATTTGNTAVLADGQGYTYVKGTQGISRISATGTVTSISTTNPTYFAVDARGNVYATTATAGQILKATYAAATDSYTTSTITLPANLNVNGTQGQAYTGPFTVDPNGNLFIADKTNLIVYRYNPTNGISAQITQTALTNPTAITQDTYGNLLVIDGTTLLKIPAAGFQISVASPVANPTVTFTTALTAPTAVAADQGENIYVADSGNIIALSLSGAQYTIPGIAGTGVAVDGSGNLFTVAAATAGETQVLRSAETHNFGTDVATAYVGVFLNTGATSATGFAQTDTGGNYSFLAPTTALATAAGTCNVSSTALAGGAACNTSIKFAPTATGSGAVPDVVSLLPAANTIGTLSLNGTKSGSTATTTTAITGNTTGLIYSTGVETTFTVTVTQSTGSPAGTVSVSIDGGTASTYTLANQSGTTASVAVPVSGLSAATHNIVATYGGSSGIAGSTSSTVSFTIAQAVTTLAWTPSATTQQFSSAVGTGVLDATATSGTTSIPGVYVYTATPTGGTATNIHSASFLAIGGYSLGVTFYPTDSTDYTTATASVSSYTVTKATTTAAVGTSQFTVAADGTGNYTTVQAAVNAIGATGGSVYIKPGTYNAFVTVVQPNVALRGLGGDPTAVVLTKSAGAFSNSGGVYQYTGEFTAANSNGAQLPTGSSLFSGDEGSATLVVAKGINTALGTTTLTPNGFYGENFTLVNTYDSDTTTTTTTYVSGNNCTANAGTARTYNDLFNNGLLCASQALAIWTTADLSVMNNIYSTSLQDTIYAGSQGSGSFGYVPARQYWFRGKVTGTVDYIFGDAAAVFDYSSIYTLPHGTGVSGAATIEAQNKATRTGGSSDYLSGYVMNSNVFTSYTTGMTGLVFGRPYGTYSTYLMLNSYVDQVAPAGYIEFSGQTNLPTSTYAEYNDILYTDPATNSADINGVLYTGLGGNTGTGVTGTRETTSQDPGTSEAANAVKTSLTLPQAQQYFPTNFLGTTVSTNLSSTTNWNPTTALANAVNAFVPTGTSSTIAYGGTVNILMRPQTPGLGAVTNGVYAVPTGTYSLKDTFNGTATVIASGTLDASGEAFYLTSSLAAGTHNLAWTYGGDGNFAGSTTATAYVINVTPIATAITLSQPSASIVYGQSQSVTAMVSATTGTPTGSVVLVIDGSTTQTATLSGGAYTFTVSGLQGGTHSFTATYAAQGNYGASSTATGLSLTVTPAILTVTGACANRVYNAPNACSATVTGYKYSDTQATVFTSTPTGTTTATRQSPAGTYPATPLGSSLTFTTAGANNYSIMQVSGSFTITGGAPQVILFAPLPNFVQGASYQLTARASSGLPVTYTVTGPASISGTTVVVSGAGTVTVTASQTTDPTGDYAAANNVSRSFTAQ